MGISGKVFGEATGNTPIGVSAVASANDYEETSERKNCRKFL